MNDWWILTGAGDRLLRLECLHAGGEKPEVISPVLTVREVCRRLGKSQRQVYRYLRSRRLKPCARILGQWLFWQGVVSQFRRTRLPGLLRRFFWDVQLSSLAVDDHRDFILARLLEFGDRASLRWVFQTYPLEAVLAFLKGRGAEVLPGRTWSFWALLLGLNADRSRRAAWRRRARHWGGVG